MSKEGYNETDNTKSIRERYKEIYSNPEKPRPFGKNPTSMVEKIPDYIKQGKVMDLGAGDGRNCSYLAKKGFQVTAIDFSVEGIRKLKKLAEKKGLKINVVVADIRNWEIKEQQDVILVNLVLHHLSRAEALELIKKIKDSTREGGLIECGKCVYQRRRFLQKRPQDRSVFY